MVKYLPMVLTVLLLACPTPVCSDEVEIGSLVLNKTLTRTGTEFYKSFFELWLSLEHMEPVHIRVNETPSARWGSIITIWVDEELCFKTRLANRAKSATEVAEQAVQQVMTVLVTRKIQQQQDGDNGDLSGDGL